MDRKKLATWRKKLARIHDEQLRDLVLNRRIFDQANQAWKRYVGQHKGGALAQWMTQNYLAFACTAIRRATDPPDPPKSKNGKKKRSTLSLVVLLNDLAQHNQMLTRKWYVSMYRSGIMRNPRIRDEFGNRDFTKLAGNANARFIPRRRIRSDIASLRRVAQPIKRLGDKVIAHTEEDRRKIGRPRWQNINQAIDVLCETYQRYYLLLNAISFDPLKDIEFEDALADLKKIWP